MTTSEAIIWFEHRKAGATMPGARMAYDMAIEALRAQREPNEPLTLDELQGMDGKPVWIKSNVESEESGWGIVSHGRYTLSDRIIIPTLTGQWLWRDIADNRCTVYRRKPEEG